MKWEYRIEKKAYSTKTEMESLLSTLGAEGWELTAAIVYDNMLFYYFKRPVKFTFDGYNALGIPLDAEVGL